MGTSMFGLDDGDGVCRGYLSGDVDGCGCGAWIGRRLCYEDAEGLLVVHGFVTFVGMGFRYARIGYCTKHFSQFLHRLAECRYLSIIVCY